MLTTNEYPDPEAYSRWILGRSTTRAFRYIGCGLRNKRSLKLVGNRVSLPLGARLLLGRLRYFPGGVFGGVFRSKEARIAPPSHAAAGHDIACSVCSFRRPGG